MNLNRLKSKGHVSIRVLRQKAQIKALLLIVYRPASRRQWHFLTIIVG